LNTNGSCSDQMFILEECNYFGCLNGLIFWHFGNTPTDWATSPLTDKLLFCVMLNILWQDKVLCFYKVAIELHSGSVVSTNSRNYGWLVCVYSNSDDHRFVLCFIARRKYITAFSAACELFLWLSFKSSCVELFYISKKHVLKKLEFLCNCWGGHRRATPLRACD
jgi:hypothetical protein